MPEPKPSPYNGLFLVPSKASPAAKPEASASPASQSLHESLYAAIQTRRLVRFLYSGKLRIAEPHDFGMLSGRARLFCYQIGGESGTGRLPDWRLFDVPRISNFEVLERTFPGNRPIPSSKHHQWEKLFIRVAAPK
jgi:hypothetical protein